MAKPVKAAAPKGGKDRLVSAIAVVKSRPTKRPPNKPNRRRSKPYRGQGRP